MPTAIQWTQETWNPTTGCDRVSPGCAHCYALTLARRHKANPKMHELGVYQKDGGRASGPGIGLTLRPEVLEKPLHWKAPKLVFVNSMSDLFHEDVPDDFIDRVFAVMALTPQHTYQVLTKRPERMQAYMRMGEERLSDYWWSRWMSGDVSMTPEQGIAAGRGRPIGGWPSPNCWLGVTAENQRWADERIPILLDTPAAVRFVSLEPLLGPIDLTRLVERRQRVIYATPGLHDPHIDGLHGYLNNGKRTQLDWVIAGGESAGPENRALVYNHTRKVNGGLVHFGWQPKPDALAWLRSLRDQCVAAGVPFFFKQYGGPKPKSAGRELDGRTWDEMPEHAL